jgi:hypothetical protein
LINYVAGKEITNLFECYHKLESVKVLGTEKVPCVGELETYRFPIFQPEKETGFYQSNIIFFDIFQSGQTKSRRTF